MERSNNHRINTACLLFLTAVAVTIALMYTRAVMVPFVFSIFAYAIVSPVVRWLEDTCQFYRSFAMAVTAVVFFLVSSLILFFVVSSIEQFVQGAEVYQQKIAQFLQWFSERVARLGLEVQINHIKEELGQLPFFSYARGVTGTILSVLVNFFLVVVFVMFFIAGERRKNLRNPLFHEIQQRVSQYLLIKISTAFVTGSLVGFVLYMFHVDLAFMFAVLTALLNFIPNLGSIVATALPLPVLFIQFSMGWEVWVVLGCLVIIQITMGVVIEPKVLGDSMKLHPVVVLLSLIFWGLVWGGAGMFLGVPITAVLRIVLTRIDITEPVAELLAGRIPESM